MSSVDPFPATTVAPPAPPPRRALGWLHRAGQRFRARRMRRMVRVMGITGKTRVLDVGGTVDIWNLVPVRPRLVLLNEVRAREEVGNAAAVVLGDGKSLPFADQSFDLVFSNSVIEHVGDVESQARFAAEVRRVGRCYWVQTPNRWFPVEPHLHTPLLHLLPRRWQRAIANRFTVWAWAARPSPDRRAFYLDHCLRVVRLLDAGDMRRLFPGAEILRERWLGWTKSLIAVRRD